MTELEPWERRIGERSKAYWYFCRYRDMGSTRSLTKLRQMLANEGVKISRTRLSQLSMKYAWVSRAEAWDDHVHTQALQDHEKALHEMWLYHATAARKLAESGLHKLEQETEDGEVISPAEARHRIIDGCMIEARSRGADLEKRKVDVEGTIRIVFTDDVKDL